MKRTIQKNTNRADKQITDHKKIGSTASLLFYVYIFHSLIIKVSTIKIASSIKCNVDKKIK